MDREAVSPLPGAPMEVQVRMAHDGRGLWKPIVPGILALLLAGSLVGGCVTIGRTVRASDTLTLSLEIPPGTPARVDTFNGGIGVSATSESRISAEVVRTGEGLDEAEAEADRDAIAVTLELVDGVAVLRAIYAPSPESIPGGSGAAVTLSVPASTSLELDTSNGPISVSGVTGGTGARTSNGPVKLEGVAGSLAVETSNGPVTIDAPGPVALAVRTSNGGISFDGGLQPGEATLETSNGGVELRLPADATFNIDAATSNSKATSELPVAGVATEGELRGTVGAAEQAAATSITVRTSNGPISLKKR